jgi:hypothetical protein
MKRYRYDNHDQLRVHLADFMAAYNFARILKTLSDLTPYEFICRIWTLEPDRFIRNLIHQILGLSTEGLAKSIRIIVKFDMIATSFCVAFNKHSIGTIRCRMEVALMPSTELF